MRQAAPWQCLDWRGVATAAFVRGRSVPSQSESASLLRRRLASFAYVKVFQSFLAVARRARPLSVQQSLRSSAPHVAPRLPPKHNSPAASTAAMAAPRFVNFKKSGHSLAPSAFLPSPSPSPSPSPGAGAGGGGGGGGAAAGCAGCASTGEFCLNPGG